MSPRPSRAMRDAALVLDETRDTGQVRWRLQQALQAVKASVLGVACLTPECCSYLGIPYQRGMLRLG